MALGARVKQRRIEFRLTQQELATLVGVKQQTIQSLESRDTKKSEHEARLAEVLGVNSEWLRLGTGPKFRKESFEVKDPAESFEITRGPPMSGQQYRLIDKLLALPDHTLDHLEPLVDDLHRLQLLEQNKTQSKARKKTR